MNIWRVLGLEPTRDVGAIRRAYATAAKQFHPEEQPEEFKRVRTAYEQAMAYARTAPRESTISGSYTTPPPPKKASAKGNKSAPKKGVATGGSYAGPVRRTGRPSPLGGPAGRRPRAEARIEPLPGSRQAEEPAWLREETADGMAELFRRAPAMAAFRELWQQEKKREDKKAWREYFSSPVFLAAQREEGFTAALRDFVEKEFRDSGALPRKFLLELAIAYGIRSRGHGSKELYYLSFAAFPGIESVRDILKLGQPVSELSHEEDKIWAACWRDYFELLSLAKNGGFEDPDRAGRWQELFARYRREKVTERPDVTRKKEGDVEYRHPYGLRLLGFFVQNDPLPSFVIQYLYDKLRLETIGNTCVKKYYQPLLDAVLPVLPDQGPVREEKVALEVMKNAVSGFLRTYGRRLPFAHTRALLSYPAAATEEETRAAREIVEMPQFQVLFTTRRSKGSDILDSIFSSPTALIPALAAQIEDRKEDAAVRAIWTRCLESSHKWARDPEYFIDLPYQFTGASPEEIGLDNREFWYYWLFTAFSAAFSTDNEEYIAKIVGREYHPSSWWRRAFTGFDESARRILQPRSRVFRLGEHELTIEFHFFYQRFLLDGAEVAEAFPWEEFLSLAGGDDLLFWLALPLATGEDGSRRAIRREIVSRMDAIHLDLSTSRLADCLVNHVCTSRKDTAAARGYGEDGDVLYGYEVRRDRTLEVYKVMGILHRREKRWDRPFATVEDAEKAGRAYLETLLAPPERLVERVPVSRMTPRKKAKALVERLGVGEYTDEDRQRDEKVQPTAVTEDFLGYGVQHHGSYTADFYRENLHRPYRAAVRFGSQEGERFRLVLTLEVWPFGSDKAKKVDRKEIFTRLGMLGESCYPVGTIGLGKDRFTLISSTTRKTLYAVRDDDNRSFLGEDLAALVEGLLYPSEWGAVEWVESYKAGKD